MSQHKRPRSAAVPGAFFFFRPGGATRGLVCLLIAGATLAVYAPVLTHEFTAYDDDLYVTGNAQVRAGITLEGLRWALVAREAANWHPVTWLSHMLDCTLFGLNPGLHHGTSLLLHIVNAALLFLLLERMTGALARSALVAAFFALHPLHVESVAWIAERKDVLSGLFWMLTLGAYVLYTERPGLVRYVWVLLLFALGLMAKPMLVTLPLVLLLLDFWPLRRIRWRGGDGGAAEIGQPRENREKGDPGWPGSGFPAKRRAVHLVFEKVPMLLLATVSSIVTYRVQQGGGAVASIAQFPLPDRVENALVAYVGYLGKAFWPSPLAVFYPRPAAYPAWLVAGAALLLVGLTFVAVACLRRCAYLAIGWLWFIGTLVPVIGLVQVGRQAMADRYSYLPLIGLFIALVWGMGSVFGGRPGGIGATQAQARRLPRWVTLTAAGVPLAACAILSWRQVGYWKNTITLFEHAIEVTRENVVAENILGTVLAKDGRLDEAIPHLDRAMRIKPDYQTARNLGRALAMRGRFGESIARYEDAVGLRPEDAGSRAGLGEVLDHEGRTDEAIAQYEAALRLDPTLAMVHNNLGAALAAKGKPAEAIGRYEEAIRLDPRLGAAHYNLGMALFPAGSRDRAIEHLREAARLDPGNRAAQAALQSLSKRGAPGSGIIHGWKDVISRSPGATPEKR